MREEVLEHSSLLGWAIEPQPPPQDSQACTSPPSILPGRNTVSAERAHGGTQQAKRQGRRKRRPHAQA